MFQKRASGTSGQTFVMEEEMLSSQGNSSKRPLQPQQQRLVSGGADPTTQMVKTTDVKFFSQAFFINFILICVF